MDMIDLLPPGLYEAVITEVDDKTENAQLIQGKYLFSLQARTLDDIRAFGGNDDADDRLFATAARLSEINLGLYRTFMQLAWVKAMVSEQSAQTMRDQHPNRVRFAAFSDRNPLMQSVKEAAQAARTNRQPVAAGNPFLAFEQATSSWISTWLDTYRIARDGMTEAFFVNFYGSPVLQALMGLNTEAGRSHRHIERDLAREVAASRASADLATLFESGEHENRHPLHWSTSGRLAGDGSTSVASRC